MVLNPTVEANASIRETQAAQASNLNGILSGIQALIGNTGNQQAAAGDIVIPVYVGGNKIDELVVNATQRMNYRSGGH